MTFNLENLRISPYYPKPIIEAWGGQEEFDLIPSVKWESIQYPLFASKIWDGRAVSPLKGSDIPFLLFSTHTDRSTINNTFLIYSFEQSQLLEQWHWKDNWGEENLDKLSFENIFHRFREQPYDLKPLNEEGSTCHSDEAQYPTHLRV